jgi:DNA helicase-2/ATP-dependent DNA helicase PcrA
MSAETRSEDETVDAARLMTLHASKGLEFSTVLVAGCEDGLIPFKRDERTGQPEDEETRLFYVGVTRAKRKLFLCRAFKRQRFGKTEYCEPSPFLDVIKNALAPGGAPADAGGYGAAHIAAGGGTRIAMGNSPAFRGRGRGVPGRGGRGGAGGGGGGRGPGGAETEANARRAARRAAAAKKAAEAAAKSAEGRGTPRVGPRAQPRSRRPSE